MSNSNQITPELKAIAVSFAARFARIAQQIEEAASELIRLLDTYHGQPVIAAIVAEGLNLGFLRRLEMRGRNQIDSVLVLKSTPAAARLISIPLSEQRHALNEGIEVLDFDETTVRLIQVDELSTRQARIAISRAGIRSLAQQRTIIREEKAKALPPVAERDRDFQVSRGCVTFLRPVKVSRALLLQIAAEME